MDASRAEASAALTSSARKLGAAGAVQEPRAVARGGTSNGGAAVQQTVHRSLRLELQVEHVASLTRELHAMRAQLVDARSRNSDADALREGERGELVASYERMLAEQAAAVRQYEARAAMVGGMRIEARKREAELTAVRQESVLVRQRLATISRVWRQSVVELEQTLEKEIRHRHSLEAERGKFAEIHRKKLQSIQREADSRSAEARKLAEREEAAVQAAATAAARQAERSYEIKAKELKAKSERPNLAMVALWQ